MSYQVKMFGRWWRVPRWFFNWHYMRRHRKVFGLTRRQHKALIQVHKDLAEAFPATLDEAVAKLRGEDRP